MLKRDDIDAVSVCVPSGMHGEVAIAAAEARKHIFCEKPLDITMDVMNQGTTSVYPAQETRFEIHGENGTIVFADSGIKQWKFLNSEEPMPEVEGRINSGSDPAKISGDGHFVLLDDLIHAIKEDRDPMVTGEEARKAVQLILAIYESSRTGQQIFINR